MKRRWSQTKHVEFYAKASVVLVKNKVTVLLKRIGGSCRNEPNLQYFIKED